MLDQKALMQRVYNLAGTEIAAATRASSVPPEFLAALIANETGGEPNASRFEPAVCAELQDVIAGRKATFHKPGMRNPLGRADLIAWLQIPHAPLAGDVGGPVPVASLLKELERLATSWGWTQIMGYHAIEFSKPAAMLTDRTGNLEFAVLMLTVFANMYSLDLGAEFTELFHCWNAGRPDRPTFDPNYVPNGLARLAAYKAILAEAPTV
jgi:hypothetical protein